MKPYFLVLYNKIRFSVKRVCQCSAFVTQGISMLSWNTKMIVDKKAKITLGARIVSDGRTVIIVGENAELSVGNGVYFNEGAMVSCKERVVIGDGCKFGPNVKVFDNDHCFNTEEGVADNYKAAPIVIGERCWLASNVVVLRGANIGDHCVIGANCVVKGVIPPGSVVTQNGGLTICPMKERKTR